MSLHATRRKPARQPEAVAAGLKGQGNPGDRAARPDRLIPPAMQHGKQPFWAWSELLARLTLNPGKHTANAMGVVNEAVEDGVGISRIAEHGAMPQ